MKNLILLLLISLNTNAMAFEPDMALICSKEKALTLYLVNHIAGGKPANKYTYKTLHYSAREIVNNCANTNTVKEQKVYVDIVKAMELELKKLRMKL